MVRNVNADTSTAGRDGDALPRNFVQIKDQLFFFVWDIQTQPVRAQWVKTEGTRVGTTFFRPPQLSSQTAILVAQLVHQESLYLFLTRLSGLGIEEHGELWRSDGTEGGTVFVKKIPQDPFGTLNFVSLGGLIWFTAEGPGRTRVLWKSDGTPVGTVPIKTLARDKAEEAGPVDLVSSAGSAFFTAYDPVGGWDLWKSDGTESGTVRVWDGEGLAEGERPHSLIDVNGTLFFTAGDYLWKSDGTQPGTLPVTNKICYEPSRQFALNGSLFFVSPCDGSIWNLWKTDGTEAGTVRVEREDPGGPSTIQRFVGVLEGALYLVVSLPGGEHELWRTDGTQEATRRVRGGIPGVDDPRIFRAIRADGTLFFTAGGELWKTDGTEEGTMRCGKQRDVVAAREKQGADLATLNGTLFFGADDGIHGMELWKFRDRDGDGDGLPDWWEDSFFTDGANPNEDPDGDGLTNWEESRTGTAPNDPASALRFTKIDWAGPGVTRVSWLSAPDQLYTLTRSAILSTNLAGYQVIRQHLRATPPINSYLDTTATGPGPYFYRVQLRP